MAYRDFNVNDYVEFRLTPSGREYHKRWYEERYPGLLEHYPYKVLDENEDGWVRMQMWCFMQEFGPGITMGMNPPFYTTIRIEE